MGSYEANMICTIKIGLNTLTFFLPKVRVHPNTYARVLSLCVWELGDDSSCGRR